MTPSEVTALMEYLLQIHDLIVFGISSILGIGLALILSVTWKR